MKKKISLSFILALSIIQSLNALEAKKIQKVEFIGMEAAKNIDEMSKMYTTAKVRLYTTDKDFTQHDLSYQTLFNVKDKIGTNTHPAGQLYNYKMEALLDPFKKPLISETPDSNSLLNIDGKLFLVNHFEYDPILSDGSSPSKQTNCYSRVPMSMALTSIQQAPNGKLQAVEQKAIDFSSVDGLWTPCFGSQTPWNTHLGSEEDYDLYYTVASGKENANIAQAGVKTMSELYFKGEKKANPYHYGYITEVQVKKNGSTKPIKHYSMGRGTWEMSKIMPDGKTAFFGDDGTNVGLYMYIADKKNDISKGTLYGAKWNQTSADGDKLGGEAKLTWIKLGQASDDEVKSWADKYSFEDIFEYATQPKASLQAIKAGHTGTEYLKVKKGMENVASHLELRRYASLKGATTEFNKMEGVTINDKDKKLYISMSYIEKGMRKDDSFARDDIKVAKNSCGATYELHLKDGVKDSDEKFIPSSYVPIDMSTTLLGEEIATDKLGNTCHVDKVANTDNIFFSEKMRTLFIAEDSDGHTNNALWAYNVDTKKLSRILSTPAGAESSGLQVVDNLNGYAYIMSSAQHLGAFTKTTPDALSSKLETKIDKLNAPIGYIWGIPAIR